MSAGAVAFSSIRLTSAVIAAQCRSNALSKALRAVFFSAAVHVNSWSNCPLSSIDDLSLCVRCPRVQAGHRDLNPLKRRLQPEKRAYRNVALRSHCKSADRRPRLDENEIALPETQTGASAARSGSFQGSRLKYSRFARIPTILSIRDRRLHRLVLFGAKACFQQDRRSPVPITTRSSPPVRIHDQCSS